MRSESKLLRVVIDSNLFVSALISKRGNPHDLLVLWRAGLFVLVISADQCAELADVLDRPAIKERYQLSDEEIASFFLLLDVLAIPAASVRRLPLHVRDPKDDHLLATALGAGADYLASGDKDLLELDGNPKVPSLRIVTAAQFLGLLSQATDS